MKTDRELAQERLLVGYAEAKRRNPLDVAQLLEDVTEAEYRAHELKNSRNLWRSAFFLLFGLVMLFALLGCEPVPTDPTPIRTADGVPVQVGERYYRTGLVAVTRSPEDQRPGVHQVRFWSSIVVGELEQREGVWFAVDTRFMDSTGTIISEPVLELWASKDKMQVSIGPEPFR